MARMLFTEDGEPVFLQQDLVEPCTVFKHHNDIIPPQIHTDRTTATLFTDPHLETILPPYHRITLPLGMHIQLQPGTVGYISGLPSLANNLGICIAPLHVRSGVHIKITIFNFGTVDFHIFGAMKIAELAVVHVSPLTLLQLQDTTSYPSPIL